MNESVLRLRVMLINIFGLSCSTGLGWCIEVESVRLVI